ncbi:hypothetical protein JG687_00015427 [Phytophthora cactorum]|uniref:Uncharacterized protein n=1 Tax=Phytophthora cactorum TaxID=29920 RepID=A0A8T1TW99_9STRA|nr:hypothetical protein JG687_00015427 [Phytophthora cactorum]
MRSGSIPEQVDPTDEIGDVFGGAPVKKTIHVLVVVPKDAGVGARVGVALIKPSAPPTTMHRHPERLKRRAAINTMIRQKNQDANTKTTSKDAENTKKKRKTHDVDRSMGYSNLCWDDIKPIYNFETYTPQLSDVPDADIDLLLVRIVDLRAMNGEVTDGKEAKRLFFIAPILETVSRLLGDAQILVEEDVNGNNFVLKRGKKKVFIVQAKKGYMTQGVDQNVPGLEALADVEELAVTYGIVTNYREWRFLVSEDVRVRKYVCTLTVSDTLPSFAGLKEILGTIHFMLSNN